MSDEKDKENKPEEEVVETASTEATTAGAAETEAAPAPEEAAPPAKAEEAPAAAPEKATVPAEAEKAPTTAPEEAAAPVKTEEAPVAAVEGVAPGTAAVVPDATAKFDKLEKAQEILKASAPAGGNFRPPHRGGFHRGGPREVEDDGSFEKVVFINRCSKVVKGGRRFSFSALVVTGDKEGKVGFGFGKAKEVAECIKKASEASKKSMVAVKVTNNTIPHPVIGEHGGGRVLLRPASPGTGLIAGGGVRAVVEAAGIKDVLAKSMGSNNPANVVKATLNALEQLRTKEEIYSLRGKRLPEKKAL